MKKFICITFLLAVMISVSLFAYEAANSDFFKEFKTLKQVCYIIHNQYYEKIEPRKMIHTMITEYLKTLDPHSAFIPPKNTEQFDIHIKGKYGGIGAVIGENKHKLITVIEPFEDSPADKAGIIPQDIILKVDNTIIKDTSTSDVANILRDDPGKVVDIIIKRPGVEKYIPFSFKRETIKMRSTLCHIIDDSVGYIHIKSFQEDTFDQIIAWARTVKKNCLSDIIVDLRDDPGGLLRMAVELSNLFFKKGTLIVSVKGRNKDSEKNFHTMNDPIFPSIPLVVLINKNSASASEIFAGAVKDHKRGVLVGKTSFGKGSVQHTFPLGKDQKDGILKLTVAKYYTPSGACIHEKGIDPDIEADTEKIPDETLDNIYKKYKDTEEISLTLDTDEIHILQTITEEHIQNNLADDKQIAQYKKDADEKISEMRRNNDLMWYDLIKHDAQIQAALKLIHAKRILGNTTHAQQKKE